MNPRLPEIFPFPAIQYIPLNLNFLAEGTFIPSYNLQNKPELIIGKELVNKVQHLPGLQINHSQNFPINTCPVLALNLKISLAKYRSFFITFLGTKAPDHYQLFTVPTERLYKERIVFEVYDESSQKPLVRSSWSAIN